MLPDRRQTFLAVHGGDAGQPRFQHLRIGLQPSRRRRFRLLLVVDDGRHDLVLHVQVEHEVFEELADIRAGLPVAGGHVGIDGGSPQVRPEPVVAAGQIGHIDRLVHGVRFPAQEDRPLLGARRPLDLAQHAGLAGFDQLEVLQAEGVALDHVVDDHVAVVAGLDPVDLAVKLVLELRDVGEIAKAPLGDIGRDRQSVLGAFQVGAHDLDRLVFDIGADEGFHRRHPVAEEDVDVLLLQA